MADKSKKTTSDIEIPFILTSQDITAKEDPPAGQYPYTRGIYPDMYRGRLWTMRQYAGYGSAEETNRRFKYLMSKGQTALSVAFDLATQIGYDSDHKMAVGEVGRTGVAIDSIEDMELLFDGIPLDQVSTSMTINSTAVILLALYITVGKKQNVSPSNLTGTIQNDILKEFIARGTYILPPQPSMKIITDIFKYAFENLPKFNSISISGYHIREAGATAAQEVAFTLSNAIAYVKAALSAGLKIDDFAPQLSFFFAAHNDLFEEIAKFRVARKMWAEIAKEKFGAKNERSLTLRFHTQTGGSTLTAQQPENNIIRTTVQALAATLGGTQSLHTNAYDEALGLPTEKSAETALRTQQILAYESGIASSADPLAGSYYLEYLTAQLEAKAKEIMAEIEKMGGSISCVENGYFQEKISDAAYKFQKSVEQGETVVVGMNRFTSEKSGIPAVLKVDPKMEKRQVERVQKLRKTRDKNKHQKAIDGLNNAIRNNENIVGPVIGAVENYATVGEISDVFRNAWKEYREKF